MFVLGEKSTQAGRCGGEGALHSQPEDLGSFRSALSRSFLFTLEALSCDLP